MYYTSRYEGRKDAQLRMAMIVFLIITDKSEAIHQNYQSIIAFYALILNGIQHVV